MRYSCKLLFMPFDALMGCSLALIILITFDGSMFQIRSKALTIIGNSEFARKHLLLLVWCSIFCLVNDVTFRIISSLGAKNVVVRSTIILVAMSSLCATINLVNELWNWWQLKQMVLFNRSQFDRFSIVNDIIYLLAMLAGGALNSYTEFDQQIYRSTAAVRINLAILIYFCSVNVVDFLIADTKICKANCWASGTCQRDNEKVRKSKSWR